MKKRIGYLLMGLLACCGAAGAAERISPAKINPAPASSRTVDADYTRVPDSLGVNIHWTDPRPGELPMLAVAGFKWVRMDFGWAGTEREKGKYDFAPFDRLLAAIGPLGIRAILILDYRNKNYDNGDSPRTAQGRAAFAKWAAAAAVHFKGRGVLWEMYNEPNIKQFWRPAPNVEDYAALALEVGKALRAAAPGEQYIGPATSTMDFKFLESCFKAGLLEYWSAVTVHPYRQKNPETVIEDYEKLAKMIGQYAPKGKKIPIVSGEWGYSSITPITPEIQGKYLARQFLTNLMCGVPVSIWYDWHDDGTDPAEKEHHFGTVANKYDPDRKLVYDAKPAYQAARTLSRVLAGFRFERRLEVMSPNYYVLVFKRGDEERIVAWTVHQDPMPVTIPGLTGRYVVADHLGQLLPESVVGSNGLTLTLTDGPVYLTKR